MADLIVVDDDVALCRMLADLLPPLGHVVRAAHDGTGLDRLLADRPADCVVLDYSLPGREDGFAIARRLRARDDLGIVMLTGADDVFDRVVGLEVGADDYVTKPFSVPELAGRIDAVVRRRAARRPRTLPFGALTLDLARWIVVGSDGRALELAATEVDLVAAFASNPGRVLSRDEVMRLAPGRGDDPLDRSIDTRIARLRRKLDAAVPGFDPIRTARGSGYLYEA